MQTLEYRTMNKAGWPPGPWHDEVDKKQWRDEVTGLPCMIRRAGSDMGHWCGYVGVPRSHPSYGRDYDSVPVDVHGGLTFADKCSHGDAASSICHVVDPGESDDVWWLGFDCAHSGDMSPGLRAWLGPRTGEVYRDQAYVTREVQSLAKQLFTLST